MERALLTGITRVSKESIFSDLNNITVITTTSAMYEDCFGFTEAEVFHALDSMELGNYKKEVKYWYDGFTFGNIQDIYNPWSIINFLKIKKVAPYWANTSSNGLISHLIQTAGAEIKQGLENLLLNQSITVELDEQIIFDQLHEDTNAIWALMLSSGYLKINQVDIAEQIYTLSLTNYEVLCMMKKIVRKWFRKSEHYHGFLQALLSCDLEAMEAYINQVSKQMFSSFDTGTQPSEASAPERFYHGFVLGLIAELDGKYQIRSNRESGFGRYDVMMEPKEKTDMAYIFEFKVFNPKKEKNLEETAEAGLKQIQKKKYEEELLTRGIPEKQIKKYAFAFRGKEVLIKE